MKKKLEEAFKEFLKIASQRPIILWIGLIVVILILWAIFSGKGSKDEKFAFTPPAVTASPAFLGPVTKYVNAIGTLRPFDSVLIKAEVNAKIKKIHFEEGSSVKEGDLLIELDDSLAKAEVMQAEAAYQRAKVEFEPKNRLADKGVAARVERDKAKAEMDKAAADVNYRKTMLEKHKIYAPFGGIIGLKEISEGQFVQQGGDLIKIVNCHPLKVDFKVAEVDVGKIYVDQECEVSIGGDSSQVFTAKITAIDPESDQISHSFSVRATLEIPEGTASEALKPGRFVSVRTMIDGEQLGILIPESAIEKIGDEDMVYRVAEGNIAIRTLVTAGTRRDGNVEIITGINEGDIVITSGQVGVLDGKEVSIKNSSSTSDIVEAVKEIEQRKKSARQKNAAK
ncbi:MAG: efflux RND transporter periplasmic adaptor subunit [Holosporaceae bacterium]|jgi:membrane fusion protein (multidrug efflux system)|nr:efflux RND transporter periplasmic adaptor subunit [Holosporaceae bacterium]